MTASLGRRDFIKLGAVALGQAAMGGGPGSATRPSPSTSRVNLLYVFADQLRYQSLGCSEESFVETPHLDAFAREGLFLRNALSSTPVCTPFRAQLLTGRYGHATGVTHNDIKLPHGETTLGELLGAAGYKTGYVGKWHLNAGRRSRDPLEREGYVRPEDRQGWEWWAAHECSHDYFKTAYYRDTPTAIAIDGYEPTVQTDLALEFLAEFKDRPFSLFLSYGPPHTPYTPPQKFRIYEASDLPLRPNVPAAARDKAREMLTGYYGLVSSLDAEFGRLLRGLAHLGLARSTLVVFSSDHGDMLLSHGYLRKQKPWQESLAIPCIMRLPGVLPAGGRSDLLFGSVDIMPTLLGFLGVGEAANVHGRDCSSDLTTLRPAADHESVYITARSRGRNAPPSEWQGVRTRDFTFVQHADGPWLLYDLKNDPYQLENRVADPSHQPKLGELLHLTSQWVEKLGDSAPLRRNPRSNDRPAF